MLFIVPLALTVALIAYTRHERNLVPEHEQEMRVLREVVARASETVADPDRNPKHTRTDAVRIVDDSVITPLPVSRAAAERCSTRRTRSMRSRS